MVKIESLQPDELKRAAALLGIHWHTLTRYLRAGYFYVPGDVVPIKGPRYMILLCVPMPVLTGEEEALEHQTNVRRTKRPWASRRKRPWK